jgi:hypothetical protein
MHRAVMSDEELVQTFVTASIRRIRRIANLVGVGALVLFALGILGAATITLELMLLMILGGILLILTGGSESTMRMKVLGMMASAALAMPGEAFADTHDVRQASSTGAPSHESSAIAGERRTIGIGYKASGALGWLGAELAWEPSKFGATFAVAPRFYSDARGIAAAFAVLRTLYANGTTPYVAVGGIVHVLYFGDVPAGGVGAYVSSGIERRWRNLGVQVGAGLKLMGRVAGSNDTVMVSQPGVMFWYAELGLRYYIQ